MLKIRLINFIILLVVIFLSISLVRSIATLGTKKKIISDTEKKLVEAKQEQQNLKRDLAKVESPEYIEKQIRNKLNLGKEGEIVLVLPTITSPVTPTPSVELSNWEKWVKLFIK
ncbi:MAG: hypothetical protein UU37_C0003G0039 [Candidatus Gottesmanbacteria bacterium GW2011_GWA2_41_12]|uniref:Septum formation initiator n=2 Tax=Candidatus Gottesmaniibacteriota TaxID=1752720 RepID=A0A0G0WVL7_9BACT|nr:MAG: hypothetical protein UT63_C0025G0015 [Candidatus Gottesmanbacteria bacterium GW2011_GWC2_39_8]KKR88465.1 MAG: hypothetical protein UU37_C0003G0039 [Candidatus Gottesmanbacteria bacterium GW2011_GWA2_41_12]